MLQLDYAYTRYAHRRGRPPYLSGLAFVVILHAILINALINALGKVDAPISSPFDVIDIIDIIVSDRPNRPPLPPPTPRPFLPPEPTAPIVPTATIPPPQGPQDTITIPTPLPTPIPSAPVISEIPLRAIASTQTGPTYPAISRRLREEGSVRLRLTIGIDGSVTDASVIDSSGFQRLDEAAVRWVLRNWRYEPAMRGDMPIEATTRATLTFRLE